MNLDRATETHNIALKEYPVRIALLLLTATLLVFVWLGQREQSSETPIAEFTEPQTGDPIAPSQLAEKIKVPTANNVSGTGPSVSSGEHPTPPAVIKSPVAVAERVGFADLQSEQRRLANAIADWRFEDYRRYSSKAHLVGEAAYQAYLYVKSCIGSETTATGYNDRLGQLQILYNRNRERVSARELETRLNRLEQGFERCDGLGENPLGAAVEWLQLAADLSYLPAQIGFYRQLPELLRQDRWAVFRRPDYLELYHQRTPDYLSSALESGHPDAFRHYGTAIIEGIVFEPDSVLALAYHHAADLAQGDGQRSLREADPVSGLGAMELREARLIGEELCERYCR
jgi:hypothetical protein